MTDSSSKKNKSKMFPLTRYITVSVSYIWAQKVEKLLDLFIFFDVMSNQEQSNITFYLVHTYDPKIMLLKYTLT